MYIGTDTVLLTCGILATVQEEWSDDEESGSCAPPSSGGVWVSRISPQLDMLTVGGTTAGQHLSAGSTIYGTGQAINTQPLATTGWRKSHFTILNIYL